jgi:outer membrane immunogenic protein
MRSLSVAAVSFLLIGASFDGPAFADGSMYRTYTDFSGLSLGVDAGVAMTSTGGANASGAVGGAHLGYNLQSGGIVGGAEADALFGAVNSGTFGGGSFNQDFLSSARVKAGYAFGNLLAYGTIGYGLSTTSYQDASGSADKTLGGAVYGAGLEYALTRMVSIRAQYLFYDFRSATYATPLTIKELDTSTNLLTLGASYHF